MAKGFNSRGMGGMGGGMNMNMMKQVQKMQQDMLKMQQELEAKTYTAAAGGGVVSATVTGKRELTALTGGPGGCGTAPGYDHSGGERGAAGRGERFGLLHAGADRRAEPAVLSVLRNRASGALRGWKTPGYKRPARAVRFQGGWTG